MIRNLKKILYVTALILLAGVCIGGCAAKKQFDIIPMGKVQMIESEKTTKREIFEKFGPPKAIAAKDEVSTFPAERIAGRGGLAPYDVSVPYSARFTHLPYYRIDSDILFELFSIGRQFTEYHRVYYYSDSILRKGVLEPESRLWILINEKTSIVEDYIFRKHYNVLIDGKFRNVKPYSSLSTDNP